MDLISRLFFRLALLPQQGRLRLSFPRPNVEGGEGGEVEACLEL